jgi:hypothetical protein
VRRATEPDSPGNTVTRMPALGSAGDSFPTVSVVTTGVLDDTRTQIRPMGALFAERWNADGASPKHPWNTALEVSAIDAAAAVGRDLIAELDGTLLAERIDPDEHSGPALRRVFFEMDHEGKGVDSALSCGRDRATCDGDHVWLGRAGRSGCGHGDEADQDGRAQQG